MFTCDGPRVMVTGAKYNVWCGVMNKRHCLGTNINIANELPQLKSHPKCKYIVKYLIEILMAYLKN